MQQRRPRVFIGLTEVAGVYTSLQQGLEELGVRALRVEIGGNPFRYRGARRASSSGTDAARGSCWSAVGSRIESASAAVRARRSHARGAARALCAVADGAIELVRIAYRIALLAIVIAGYDVVVVTNGASFFRGHDLRLLHHLGKHIVVVFTGSDHRPPFLNGKQFRMRSPGEMVAETRRIHDFVVLAEKYATVIVALSSSAQFHRRPFVHFLAVGIPFAPGEVEPVGRAPVFTGTGVRILHCPTDLIGKGTGRVRTIVDELRRDGLAIDYVELSGRPHHEIMAALAECDFAIDELHSDTPLARFATEAAWSGKPAVTAGEYAREIAQDLPASLIPPSTFVPSEQVGAVVRRFVTDTEYRQQRGRAVEEFVRDQWNPRAVARRFLRIIEDDVPPEWMYDPARLTYIGGWGLDDNDWRLSVGAIVQTAGVGSLGLSEPLVGRILARLGDEPSAHAPRSMA